MKILLWFYSWFCFHCYHEGSKIYEVGHDSFGKTYGVICCECGNFRERKSPWDCRQDEKMRKDLKG